jgi:hypothetical protein
MTQPITNNFTTPNQNNYNLGLQEIPAEFSGFKVFATNPTISIQDQAETSKTPEAFQTNIADRISTSANPPDTITIKPFDEFININKILDYFYNIMDSIYKSHNVKINPNVTKYINYRKKIKHETIKEIITYEFWLNFIKLIAKQLTQNNHEIFDITDAIFYLPAEGRICIDKDFMNYLANATDDKIQKLAENKNLYRLLQNNKHLRYIASFKHIETITRIMTENDTNKNRIFACISKRTTDSSRKSLIKTFVNDLFEICLEKDIYIDNKLYVIINYLLTSREITDNEVQQILYTIKFFFNCFSTCNSITDTSIFTEICCCNHKWTKKQLVSSVCNITNEQIKFITSCKNKSYILKDWIATGFPAKKKIDEIIDNHKKNNTDDNSIKHVVTAKKKPIPALAPNQKSKNNEKLNYLFNEITSVYAKIGATPDPKFRAYIYDITKQTDYAPSNLPSLILFFENFLKFIYRYIELNNNEILDITETIFYLLRDRLHIIANVKRIFINATDQQIQELAKNKDFYRTLLVKKQINQINPYNMDFNTTGFIVKLREENNRKQENIYSSIDNSKVNDVRKDLVKKYVKTIFTICRTKDIYIENKLLLFVKSLLNQTIFNHYDIEKILNKTVYFFSCFDDYNTVLDTSILTNICCGTGINNKLIESINNINNNQITFITSCKNKRAIIESWYLKGFPETKEITKIIDNFKKLDAESTDSSGISKEIDIKVKSLGNNKGGNTEFDNQFAEWLRRPTDHNKEDLDGASKKIDDIVKDIQNNPHKQTTNDNENYDELWNLVKDLSDNSTFTAMNPDDAPNGLPEPNNTNESSLEHSPNKIPRLS